MQLESLVSTPCESVHAQYCGEACGEIRWYGVQMKMITHYNTSENVTIKAQKL